MRPFSLIHTLELDNPPFYFSPVARCKEKPQPFPLNYTGKIKGHTLPSFQCVIKHVWLFPFCPLTLLQLGSHSLLADQDSYRCLTAHKYRHFVVSFGLVWVMPGHSNCTAAGNTHPRTKHSIQFTWSSNEAHLQSLSESTSVQKPSTAFKQSRGQSKQPGSSTLVFSPSLNPVGIKLCPRLLCRAPCKGLRCPGGLRARQISSRCWQEH